MVHIFHSLRSISQHCGRKILKSLQQHVESFSIYACAVSTPQSFTFQVKLRWVLSKCTVKFTRMNFMKCAHRDQLSFHFNYRSLDWQLPRALLSAISASTEHVLRTRWKFTRSHWLPSLWGSRRRHRADADDAREMRRTVRVHEYQVCDSSLWKLLEQSSRWLQKMWIKIFVSGFDSTKLQTVEIFCAKLSVR